MDTNRIVVYGSGIIIVLGIAWIILWFVKDDSAPITTNTGMNTITIPVVETSGFDRTGNLVQNNPGMEEGVWYLVYDEPGAPALTQRLTLATSSTCVQGDRESSCDGSTFEQGQRVRIMGEVSGQSVVVTRLEYE